MLNVSQITQTKDKTFPNIKILSRPVIQSSQSSVNPRAQQSQQQHNESVNKTANNANKISSPSSSGFSSVQSTTGSLSAIGSPSQASNQSTSCSSVSSIPSSTLSNGSHSSRSTVLANNQNTDKSPMCLINELSRSNDIKHEYHLVEEFGPPHDKTFTVVLKLGDSDEYRASGPSIKKAQRSAATLALEQTKLRHPSPRTSNRRESRSMWPLTPTVELNVLAMKLGESAVYHVYEPPRPQPSNYPFGAIGATSAYDFRGMHFQRYHTPRGQYCATLKVGSRQFVGKGRTAQAARHAAAEEALKMLRELPLPANSNVTQNNCNNSTSDAIDDSDKSEDYIKSPISLVHEQGLRRNLTVKFEVIGESGPSHMPKFVTQCTVGDFVATGEGNGKKISKKNAAVLMLDELNKLGPLPTINKSDDKVNDHNDSTYSPNQRPNRNHRKKPFVKKKRNNNNNVIKNSCVKPEDTEANNATVSEETNNKINNNSEAAKISSNSVKEDTNNKSEESNIISINCLTIHPINRLIQIQQARKEKEPQFTVISDRCTDRRRREFTIECTIHISKGPNAPNVVTAIGLGPNKKVAKKNAAECMLQQLGYSSKPLPQSILKQDSSEGQSQRKGRQVKFVEDRSGQQLIDITANLSQTSAKLGRQLVPGLILMPTEVNVCLKNGTNSRSDTITISDSSDNDSKNLNICANENTMSKMKLISMIATEYLDTKNGCSQTALSLERESDSDSNLEMKAKCGPTEQLLHLAEVIGAHTLQVHFSDFPKKHNNQIEYLSVVTITSILGSMPFVSHGTGSSQEESRNQASHQALSALSQLQESQNFTKI